MLNGNVFYDNAKYFSNGAYYSWFIYGKAQDSTKTAITSTVDKNLYSDNTTDIVLMNGEVSLRSLGAFSTPKAGATYAFTGDSESSSTGIDASNLRFTFPTADNGTIVNLCSTSSDAGIMAAKAALIWFKNADAVNSVLGSVNPTLVNAKVKWGFLKSGETGAADLASDIGDVKVKTLKELGNSNVAVLYTTNISSVSSPLNSYNYSGFTVGSLQVTLSLK